MHNNCDGCLVKNDAVSCTGRNSDASCPCTDCVVKVICVDTPGECEMYDAWYTAKKLDNY
jgi:hypothetical protein